MIWKTNIITSKNFEVLGEDISYDKKKKIIFSEKDTTIIDPDGNKVFVNMFNFFNDYDPGWESREIPDDLINALSKRQS